MPITRPHHVTAKREGTSCACKVKVVTFLSENIYGELWCCCRVPTSRAACHRSGWKCKMQSHSSGVLKGVVCTCSIAVQLHHGVPRTVSNLRVCHKREGDRGCPHDIQASDSKVIRKCFSPSIRECAQRELQTSELVPTYTQGKSGKTQQRNEKQPWVTAQSTPSKRVWQIVCHTADRAVWRRFVIS